jgi:hypothetical protein
MTQDLVLPDIQPFPGRPVAESYLVCSLFAIGFSKVDDLDQDQRFRSKNHQELLCQSIPVDAPGIIPRGKG